MNAISKKQSPNETSKHCFQFSTFPSRTSLAKLNTKETLMRSFFTSVPVPRLSTLWLLGSFIAVLWLGLGRDFRHDQAATASTSHVHSPSEISLSADGANLAPTTVVPIASIQVGQQLLAEHPTGERDLQFGETVDPPTWRKLSLKALKRDGSYADVTLLRPLTWLDEKNAEVGGTVQIDVPECGISGKAAVLAIEPCPPIEHDRRYRIVTGVFKHHSARIVEVHVEGLAEPIGTTANHPFWSEDRQSFIRADQLRIGEQLRTRHGAAPMRKVVPLKDTEPVFNLEVQCDHVYLVAQSGVLVHNAIVPLSIIECPFELSDHAKGRFRTAARQLVAEANGYPVSEIGMDVHHLIPLEWAHIFPNMDPNELKNLVALDRRIHTQVTTEWNAWRESLNGATPTAQQVLDQAEEIFRRFGQQFIPVP